MIDTHIHVVPGVDDGAQTLEESIAMIHMALEEGITGIIATPHYKVPIYESAIIDQQFALLKAAVAENHLDMRLYLANEIHVNEASIVGIESGLGRTMAGSGYLLLELPFHHYYPFHEELLYRQQMKGYKVVIAHVERYRVFRQNETKLGDLIDAGFYGQLTCRYIAEHKTRAKALRWIEAGYIHVVGTDAHNCDRRPPLMRTAYNVVKQRFGTDVAELLFVENAEAIIEDRPMQVPDIRMKLKDRLVFRFNYWFDLFKSKP